MTEIIDFAKLSSINQITVPKYVRKQLNLQPKDRIAFIKKDNDIIIKKAESQNND